MQMLSYHPALDPYHASFRILRALILKEGAIEGERLRLFDLYLLFPHLAAEMTLPSAARGWRATLKTYQNPYWFSGDAMLIFQQIRPIHETGLGLLQTTGFVEHDDTDRDWTLVRTDHPLAVAAEQENEMQEVLSRFFQTVLIPLELGGRHGLKARSGLIEWRYDEI